MKPSDLTVTDQFCGAGGSSIGAEAAGARVVLGMNHWKIACETYANNHPQASVAVADISSTDPRRFPSTNILITSPECTNHSQAKTKRAAATLFDPHGADEAERSRATMMDVPRFAEYHGYDLIIAENVVEVTRWAGFEPWIGYMRNLGYDWRAVSLNSMVARPTPQSRDRLYFVFWKRGNAAPDLDIRPAATCSSCGHDVEAVQSWRRAGTRWGKYRQQYDYRCPACASLITPHAFPALSALDLSLPTQRIGDRRKPLAAATRRRVEVGIERFWLPAMIPVSRGTDPDSKLPRPASAPMPTCTSRLELGVATPPFVAELRGGWSDARTVNEPLATVTASGNHHGLVTPPEALYVKNYGRIEAAGPMAHSAREPFGTVTAVDHHSVVTPPLGSFLATYYGNGGVSSVGEPCPTLTTRDRCAYVTPAIEVDDCGFRMLEPHEDRRRHGLPRRLRGHGKQAPARPPVRQRRHPAGHAAAPRAGRREPLLSHEAHQHDAVVVDAET